MKMENEKITAGDMQRKAMERQAETQRRQGEENNKTPQKKRRRNDTIVEQ